MIRRIARISAFLFPLLFCFSATAAVLTPDLLSALQAAVNGNATSYQRGLLFANNDTINRSRLNNWISDREYQAAQKEFAALNEKFGSEAAEDAGAGFTKQVSKSKSYSPGTDSDYITKVDSPEQIRHMKESYNRRINEFLAKEKVPCDPMTRWEALLDTDFMADPRHVTQAQFEEIARMNNAAYTRREAAEFELISRAKDGTLVSAGQARAYAEEMQDFIRHKQEIVRNLRSNPNALNDPDLRADIYKTSAQEQKYIERVEADADLVRRQNGLKPVDRNMLSDSYSVVRDANGNIIMKLKHIQDSEGNIHFQERAQGSIAARGSVRDPGRTRMVEDVSVDTATADAVSQNSLNRALADLAEAQAQAAAVNSDFARSAARDIAVVSRALPPSEKGFLLERIRKSRGSDFAADVAKEMRSTSPPRPNDPVLDRQIADAAAHAREAGASNSAAGENPILARTRAWDLAFQKTIGLSSDTAELSLTRRQANEIMQRGLPKLNAALGAVFIAKEAYDAGGMMGEFVYHLTAASGQDVPDAVAQQHYEAAQALAYGMVEKGVLGSAMIATMEAFPTVGAVVGTYAATYEGTRFVLENTRTGRYIDKVAGGGFDIGFRAADRLSDAATALTGGRTQAQRAEDEGNRLCQSYLNALDRGQIRLRPGTTKDELCNAARQGDIGWIRSEIIEEGSDPTKPKPPKPKDPGRTEGGGPYAIGTYVVNAGDNLSGKRGIGIVLPKEEYAKWRTYKFEEHYGDLKILREGLSVEEARQFIFLALFGPDAPIVKGDFGIATYSSSENKTILNVIQQNKAAANREAYMRANFRDLNFIREDIARYEAEDWLCLQVKVLKGTNPDHSCSEDQYAFQGKAYPTGCTTSVCQAWRGFTDKLPYGDKLAWGIPVSRKREEYILNHIPELLKAPLTAPSTERSVTGNNLALAPSGIQNGPAAAPGTQPRPATWSDVAQLMQGGYPAVPSNRAVVPNPGSRTWPQTWQDVSQQMQNRGSPPTPPAQKPTSSGAPSEKSKPHDLAYVLANRKQPDLVTPAELDAALENPLLWQQPEIQKLIDDGWLAQAKPELAVNDPTARYEEWGRIVGRGITVAGPPEIHEPRIQYLWRNAARFPSLNLCSMKDFVIRSIKSAPMGDCRKNINSSGDSLRAGDTIAPAVRSVRQGTPSSTVSAETNAAAPATLPQRNNDRGISEGKK